MILTLTAAQRFPQLDILFEMRLQIVAISRANACLA
jgi:hypothetical protein